MEYNEQTDREEIYSRPVRAGKRTYFLDVKSTRGDDLYLTITESKKKFKEDGTFFFEKHKIFLYKEDFEKFTEGLNDAIQFIMDSNGVGVSSDQLIYTMKIVSWVLLCIQGLFMLVIMYISAKYIK